MTHQLLGTSSDAKSEIVVKGLGGKKLGPVDATRSGGPRSKYDLCIHLGI